MSHSHHSTTRQPTWLHLLICCSLMMVPLCQMMAADAVVVDAAGNTTVNGALTVVGPFSATGYVKGTAELDAAGWATYADVAGIVPVDGTAGAANVTWARSATTPLEGTGSFVLTKDAANRQGQGVSGDFTICDGDKQRTLEISFDVLLDSGVYATGDVQVFVFDRDAGVLLDTPIKIVSAPSSVRKHFLGFFQSGTSLNYRLIFHIASTTASNFALKIDRVVVRPNGQIITEWQDAGTMTITGSTTNPTLGAVSINKLRWRRVGDSVEAVYDLIQTSAGTPGVGYYLFALPAGMQADLNKVQMGNQGSVPATSTALGAAYMTNYVSATGTGTTCLYDSNRIAVYAVGGTAGTTLLGHNWYALGGTSVTYRLRATVPILNW